MEFIGKLHPLIVHLPIGLIIAAFGLELVFRKVENPLALKSIVFLIGLTGFTGVVASIFGYLLSITSGYDSTLVDTHQWWAIAFSVAVIVFFFYRRSLSGKRTLWLSWFAVLSLLMITGHFGGSLTHGENYLSDSAPAFMRSFLKNDKPSSFSEKPLDSILVFEDIVQPVMEAKCWNCHNQEKSKGRLNLETMDGWKKGGKDGDLIIPGNVYESNVLRRIYLPLNDKKHMPPMGKPQLSSAEVAVLEWWISNGADYEARLVDLESNQRVDVILDGYMGRKGMVPELDLPNFSDNDLAHAQNLSVKIVPMARQSNQLEALFRGDSVIGEDHLSSLSALSKNILRVDLSFSGVTNDQLKPLSKLENLTYLSLANTSIDDNGIGHLVRLKNLQVLNLHSTNVTVDCLSDLTSMTGLKRVFLWNTKIPGEKLKEFAAQNPVLKVVY